MEPTLCIPATIKRDMLLSELSQAIQQLLRMVQRPPWSDASVGALRVSQPTAANLAVTASIASGQTLGTVTTVSAVTKINDMDLNRLSWAQNIRGRIV